MGSFLNPGTIDFEEALNSEIYIDKSGLIEITNAVLRTQQKFMCISRPRRFGKSMAANMLSAYYDRSVNSEHLFRHLRIHGIPSFQEHLNQYDVIKINMQDFLSSTHSVHEMLKKLQKYLIFDLQEQYPHVRLRDETDFVQVMKDVFSYTKCPFIILIDEWDCLFREYREDKEAQRQYLDFLRNWLKDKSYIALAYMTGILPIKKYGTHSALNMFTEYSMTDPGDLAEFFGFTESEVATLCQKYSMNFDEAKAWYNGYQLISHSKASDHAYSMYSPKSVVESMLRHKFGPYWNQTETYEALKVYIQMNMDGLKDSIIEMLAGSNVPVNTETFSNDMTTFASKDDVLTLLVHLGYLTYHSTTESVAIPNREVSKEYVNAISTMDWPEVIRSIQASRELLNALWSQNSDAVAAGIDQAHQEISILQYNDENSLSCTISLAFYFAREYYTIVRELPSGKGFADLCFLPRKSHIDKPAAVIELKWEQSAEGAIEQIRRQQYIQSLKDYHGNLLLVGINYDRKTKKHTCKIEKLTYPIG